MENRKITNFEARKKAIEVAKKRAKLKRKIIIGTLIFLTAEVVGLGIYSSIVNKNNNDSKTITTTLDNDDTYSIDIATNEVLGVALVNDGYDDTEFSNAVKKLQDEGLHCSGVDIEDIDLNTIDSQFLVGVTSYEGDDTKIIANYNSGNNGSDQLAVAMSVAAGHDATDLQRGIVDVEKADGSFKPSRLEEVVGNTLVSNITVAYPLGEEIDTDQILEASARITDYFKHDGSTYDEMLYRVQPGDSPFSLGDNICSINKISKDSILDVNKLLLVKPLSESFSPNASTSIEKINKSDYNFGK